MIRVGLAGFGLAGRVFHAPLLASVPGFELVAVMERTGDEAAKRYPGIRTVRSFEELLQDPALSLVVIATPNETHFELAKKAIAAGKNLVIDKPMAITSSQIAELAAQAKSRGVQIAPFHNRRWDADFLTVRKVLREESLGRLVAVQSSFDRWSPGATRKPWKSDPAQGGILLDLGTHLVDQALVLFGKPRAVSADVDRERDGEGANDSFTLRLQYDGLRVTLAANLLSSLPGPRFSLRGTKGSFRKLGVDHQEAMLSKITRIDNPSWGQELATDWGTLHIDIDGGVETEPVESVPGDYRMYYAMLREALNGRGPLPATPADAWRAARVLEWAEQSAKERREILCDWAGEID